LVNDSQFRLIKALLGAGMFNDLDMIISVGYRVKSKQGISFRRWATARLKEYLTQGYTINQKRLQQNAHELEQALALIQKTANSSALTLPVNSGTSWIAASLPLIPSLSLEPAKETGKLCMLSILPSTIPVIS